MASSSSGDRIVAGGRVVIANDIDEAAARLMQQENFFGFDSAKEAEDVESYCIKKTVNRALLTENYAGVRRAIADFLRTEDATAVLELQRYLNILDKSNYDSLSARYAARVDDVTQHDWDPEYATFSVDALCKTAGLVREYADRFTSRDSGALPINPRYKPYYRTAHADELQGLDGGQVYGALFVVPPDEKLLEVTIAEGWMELAPAVPTVRGFPYYVIIRGKSVGIFNDRKTVEQSIRNIPKAKCKGCRTFFDAFALFVMHWLKGRAGLYAPPPYQSSPDVPPAYQTDIE